MSLAARVASRLDATKLDQLNGDSDGVSSSTLASAVTDAIADLAEVGGMVYDDDEAKHHGIAVIGVVLYLQSYKVEANAFDKLERWHKMLERRRQNHQGNRVMPKSTSELTPTDEAAGGEIVRPRAEPRGAMGEGLVPTARRGDGGRRYQSRGGRQ